MLAHPQAGRGCPAGHRGRTDQGVRHTRGGEVLRPRLARWRVVVLLSCRKIKYKYTTKKLYKILYV